MRDILLEDQQIHRPKLIIQIPCFNEEAVLAQTLRALPRRLAGIAAVEFLVVDDGSTDATSEVARLNGAHHVLRLPAHRGLAHAFQAGLRRCLELGADIIVNTDADNQYDAACIASLLEPVLDDDADMVIGARPIRDIPHFSPVKKAFQWLGSRVVRWVSGTSVEDAPSGFRAFTRGVAERCYIVGTYTYTLEMIIQSALQGFRIASVPVRVNPPTRPSRLVKSSAGYIWRSAYTILRVAMLYMPLRFFLTLTVLAWLPAAGILVHLASVARGGSVLNHPVPLILASVLTLLGALFALAALMGDLLATNRRLIEENRMVLLRLRRALEHEEYSPPDPPPADRHRLR